MDPSQHRGREAWGELRVGLSSPRESSRRQSHGFVTQPVSDTLFCDRTDPCKVSLSLNVPLVWCRSSRPSRVFSQQEGFSCAP